MARYTDSVCRMCRREGTKLFLKGDKCFSAKCAQTARPTPPGQHGQARARKASEYGTQLREKQKARRAYGLMEGQFRRTFVKAEGMKEMASHKSSAPTETVEEELAEVDKQIAEEDPDLALLDE